MEHAATRAERRQEAATQSQPEFDSLAVGLPAQGWLAKPAAPETERLAADRLYHRLQLDGGARLKLSASLGSTLRASGFDLS